MQRAENNAVVGANMENVTLTRLFSISSNARHARGVLNRLLTQNQNARYTIIGLALYPVLKWSLYGENTQDLMDFDLDSSDFLIDTRNMLRSVFGVGRDLDLRVREDYFSKCHIVVEIYEKFIYDALLYNYHGEQMAAALMTVMNIDGKDKGVDLQLSRYELNRYLPEAVELLNVRKGKEIQYILERILNPETQLFEIDDAEYRYAYHNVNLLLKEYSRLYYARQDTNDLIAKILHAKNPEEIRKITERDDVLYSADTVLQFILLVSGAISMVEYFPVNGPKYASVLRILVSDRRIERKSDDNGSPFLKEGELAIALNLTSSQFSVLKSESLTLLSIILWGYDGQGINKILALKKKSDESE